MTETQIKLDRLRTKFKELMGESGWDKVFNNFADSMRFDILMENLKKEYNGEGVTPKTDQMFRAFKECPYNDLKVIMIGQDPYPTPGVADGIAFSCSNTGKVQPSLKVMFKELEKVYPDGYTWDPDLKRWSNQGVLMLNTALTTTPGKIGKHYNIWKPFTQHLLTQLVMEKTGLIYVFMGSAAKEWSKIIPEENYQMFCYHPASASYNGGEWESNDIFIRINQILQNNHGESINW